MGETSGIAHRFGSNLRGARKAAGLSQEAAGIRAGLHRTEIGLLERGERLPRLDTLIKLASAVGVMFECPLLVGLEWMPGTAEPGSFRVEPEAARLVREGREELEERAERGDRRGRPEP